MLHKTEIVNCCRSSLCSIVFAQGLFIFWLVHFKTCCYFICFSFYSSLLVVFSLPLSMSCRWERWVCKWQVLVIAHFMSSSCFQFVTKEELCTCFISRSVHCTSSSAVRKHTKQFLSERTTRYGIHKTFAIVRTVGIYILYDFSFLFRFFTFVRCIEKSAPKIGRSLWFICLLLEIQALTQNTRFLFQSKKKQIPHGKMQLFTIHCHDFSGKDSLQKFIVKR